MNSLYLMVEVELGQPIENVCRDAVALAKRIEIPVLFRVNGIGLRAKPDTDPENLIHIWKHYKEDE